MNNEKILTIIVITACLGVVIYGLSFGKPIERYVPRNNDGSQIILLIDTFNTAKTEDDLETYLACLNDKGRFMFSGGVMVSKNDIAKLLSKFWSDINSRDLLVRPMCRESINGNFFDGSLYDPIITIEKQKAKAVLTFKS